MRLAALSPQAAQRGLACGMALADARALVPELISLTHDPDGDALLLKKMARHCIAYTPSVMPCPPRAILLDISGCAHLHGGEQAMGQKIIADFRERGHNVRLRFADTPDAARALARYGGDGRGGDRRDGDNGDVRALCLDALEVGAASQIALRRAGFRTIGELADLPAAPLAARFGAHLVRRINRLMGREDPHIVPHMPPVAIRAELRFPEPIGRHDDVSDAIEWLIGEVAGQLAQAGQGGRAFAISLSRSDGHVARLMVETGTPTRDKALVMRLVRERIDSLADPLDPGFGYDSISLCVTRAEGLDVAQRSLAPSQQPDGDVGQLLDRLAVRYGPAAILRFAAANSHIPERAAYLTQAQGGACDTPWLDNEPGEPPLRPLFLFDPPQLIDVLAAIPDGPPRRFRWRSQQYIVRLYEGPERIAPEWWRRRDGCATPGYSRDYYRVEDEDGHRFWLFRHGLYGRETSQPRWYVHGLFA